MIILGLQICGFIYLIIFFCSIVLNKPEHDFLILSIVLFIWSEIKESRE